MNAVFLRRELERFLLEDLGSVEVDGSANNYCRGTIVAEAPGIMCGGPFVAELFKLLATNGLPTDIVDVRREEGNTFPSGADLVRLNLPAEILRHGIRTVLNLLQHLMGIATHTEQLVRRMDVTDCQLLDTRKTTPGLRAFEKYAVRTGGGKNHRFGRYDGVMIKKEDLAFDGGVTRAIDRALASAAHLSCVEIEVESLDVLEDVLKDGRVRHVLLDNMTPELVRQCVERTVGERMVLEASGIKVEDLEVYAETGVPFISTSDLIRGARPLPMRFKPA